MTVRDFVCKEMPVCRCAGKEHDCECTSKHMTPECRRCGAPLFVLDYDTGLFVPMAKKRDGITEVAR